MLVYRHVRICYRSCAVLFEVLFLLWTIFGPWEIEAQRLGHHMGQIRYPQGFGFQIDKVGVSQDIVKSAEREGKQFGARFIKERGPQRFESQVDKTKISLDSVPASEEGEGKQLELEIQSEDPREFEFQFDQPELSPDIVPFKEWEESNAGLGPKEEVPQRLRVGLRGGRLEGAHRPGLAPKASGARKPPHNRLIHVRESELPVNEEPLRRYHSSAGDREVETGRCWKKTVSEGHCQQVYMYSVSRDECCQALQVSGLGTEGGWTPGTLMAPKQFFDHFVVGRASDRCVPCHTSCQATTCPQNRVCRKMEGLGVKCVCPGCSEAERGSGSVCGFDGITYLNHCDMKTRHCLSNSKQSVDIDYMGPCQNSCAKVKCSAGKYCLLDQLGAPHCIACLLTCDADDVRGHMVCADNGHTYRSLCDLRRAACLQRDRRIRFLHTGKCRTNVTCSDIECPVGQKCLASLLTTRPVCMDCENECRHPLHHQKVCGHDDVTYDNYCTLMNESCFTGVYIGLRHYGQCGLESSTESLADDTVSQVVNSHNLSLYDDGSNSHLPFNTSDYSE